MEYFEESHWNLRQAHCHAAKVCLKLLIETYSKPDSGSAAGGSDDECNAEQRELFDPKHPLQIYSRHHWMSHVHTQEGEATDSALVRILKAFLGSPGESSSQYRRWYHQIDSDGWRSKPSTSPFLNIRADEISPENTSILAMCRFSLFTPLSDWWDKAEIAFSQTNSRGDNVLTLAVKAGCKSICEVLIKRGMQVDMPGGVYGSPLAAAAYCGRTEIVEFLVEKGANVNMPLQSGDYGSALTAAAYRGRTGIVKFLVEKGADVNMALRTGRYGSALTAATAGLEGTEIAKFLVENGADVNMALRSGDFGSAR